VEVVVASVVVVVVVGFGVVVVVVFLVVEVVVLFVVVVVALVVALVVPLPVGTCWGNTVVSFSMPGFLGFTLKENGVTAMALGGRALLLLA